MKRIIIVFVCVGTLAGCGLRAREKQLESKAAGVAQKERELVLREETLQMKEEALAAREKKLESTLIFRQQGDSSMRPDSTLAGNWSVRMNCIETTCSGSAVGDTKNEHWEISFQDKLVIARALSGNTLTRIYTGGFQDKQLNLTAQQEDAGQAPAAVISVTLTVTGNNKMEGQRIISRPDDCRIVYALDINKQ